MNNSNKDLRDPWVVLCGILGKHIGDRPSEYELPGVWNAEDPREKRVLEFFHMLRVIARRNEVHDSDLQENFADIGTLLLTEQWLGGTLPLNEFLLQILRFEILPRVGWVTNEGLQGFLKYVKKANENWDRFEEAVQETLFINKKTVSLVRKIVSEEAKQRNLKMPTVEVTIYADREDFEHAHRVYYPTDSVERISVAGFCKDGKIHIPASSPTFILAHEFWHAVQNANGKPSDENEADEIAFITRVHFLTTKLLNE